MAGGSTKVAKELHKQCKGGTNCDCQHDISGSMIADNNLTIRGLSVILERKGRMAMLVYLSHYRKSAVEPIRDQLELLGFAVYTNYDEPRFEQRIKLLRQADYFVIFLQNNGPPAPNRSVEFGYALSQNADMLTIGRSNTHSILRNSKVSHLFETVDDFYRYMRVGSHD